MGGNRNKNLKNWSTTKKKWFANNKPDYDKHHYICWLCKKPVHITKVTLDHVMPVENWPEYAKELSNIKPAHDWCNHERHAQELSKLKGRNKLGIKRWR